MKKFILAAAVVATLAVPAAASADAPTGTPVFNDASGVTLENSGAEKAAAIDNGENIVAWGSSALIQNGQFVSGKVVDGTTTPDWQHQKGNRAANIQAELALTDRGSLK